MPDRRTDYEARERIERLHVAYVAFARRVFVALAIITLAVVASLAITGYLIQENRDRAVDIQRERAASIRLTCDAQNHRHDAALATLDSIFAKVRKSADANTRAQLAASKGYNVQLIEALTPKRNCADAVDAAVRTGE